MKASIVVFIALLGLFLVCPERIEGGGSTVPELYHGTLNLCIGNTNGAVVVTDSRASGLDENGSFVFQDWHQKLFQISKDIVVTIAGYNSVPLRAAPEFYAPAAGVILSYISENGRQKHSPSYAEAVGALSHLVGFYLTSVSNIKRLSEKTGVPDPRDYHFVMLIIGPDRGVMKVTRVDVGLDEYSRAAVPVLQAVSKTQEKTIKSFTAVGVGRIAVAEEMLTRYVSATTDSQRDNLSVDEMKNMALNIMNATIKKDRYVGGNVQLAVSTGEGFEMKAPGFPPPPSPGIHFVLVFGNFDQGSREEPEHTGHWLMIANVYEDSVVFLNGHYYYFGNRLWNCTVVLEDESFSFDTSNQVLDSTLLLRKGINTDSKKVKELISSFPWKNK